MNLRQDYFFMTVCQRIIFSMVFVQILLKQGEL